MWNWCLSALQTVLGVLDSLHCLCIYSAYRVETSHNECLSRFYGVQFIAFLIIKPLLSLIPMCDGVVLQNITIPSVQNGRGYLCVNSLTFVQKMTLCLEYRQFCS